MRFLVPAAVVIAEHKAAFLGAHADRRHPLTVPLPLPEARPPGTQATFAMQSVHVDPPAMFRLNASITLGAS
jgi:hypothetical protein